jgi:hypothetical protein
MPAKTERKPGERGEHAADLVSMTRRRGAIEHHY